MFEWIVAGPVACGVVMSSQLSSSGCPHHPALGPARPGGNSSSNAVQHGWRVGCLHGRQLEGRAPRWSRWRLSAEPRRSSSSFVEAAASACPGRRHPRRTRRRSRPRLSSRPRRRPASRLLLLPQPRPRLRLRLVVPLRPAGRPARRPLRSRAAASGARKACRPRCARAARPGRSRRVGRATRACTGAHRGGGTGSGAHMRARRPRPRPPFSRRLSRLPPHLALSLPPPSQRVRGRPRPRRRYAHAPRAAPLC